MTMHPVFTLVLALVITSFCGVSPALNSLVINLIVFFIYLFFLLFLPKSCGLEFQNSELKDTNKSL